ncbi:ATP-binding protein [Ruminococcaceae bacterium OttesenSCG-928-D13]|nr:ATP-binding protein [Ruminococcaceae bacterium OttesenSCG-928-D13]
MRRVELYRCARRVVESRRQAAQARMTAEREAAHAAAPALAGLDAAIAAAGAAAARLAADGQREAAEAQTARRRSLTEERRQLLVALGYKDGTLKPHYTCPHCNDLGEVDGRVCDCVHAEALRLRRAEINEGGPLNLCRFESFSLERYPVEMENEQGVRIRPRDIMAGILQSCRDWAAEFGPRSPSLYMFGYAGLGKTHLALSIAGQVLEQGGDVIYVSAQRAFATVAAGEDGGELFASMLEADLLVLDDLGTEFLNAFIRSKLYDLVNARMGRRPTIYTSNICSQELLNQRYDEKIASRLLGGCERMRFWGEDIRLQRA